MNTEEEGFLTAVTSLWLRLSTVAMVALFTIFALQLHTKILGWSFYLNNSEILFEAAAYAVFVALTCVALGLAGAIALAPFLFFVRASSRRRTVRIATQAAVGAAAFLDFWVALQHLPGWSSLRDKLKIAIFVLYLLGFVVALCIPRRREQLVTSLDDYLGRRATRRAVIGTGLAAAGLVIAEGMISNKASAAVKSKRISPPSGPNILLVTFDALGAEDMSLYGYRLPTTPHMEEFASKSTVFSNFYSASTFTTPSVASIITGRALSEHQVYQLTGQLHNGNIEKTLPHVMRAAGYSTGASISNPFAYFLAQGIAADYDYLPEPTYRTADFMRFWDATRMFHQPQRFGSRAAEFEDLQNTGDNLFQQVEEFSPRLLGHTVSGFPPSDSFKQARQVLEKMPNGFFMWVHVLAPHAWYLPKANLGRFLPTDDLRTAESQNSNLFPSEYPPERQGLIDKARLRYNEFLADTDSEFGAFISGMERSGKLRNTAVIVSADHGESFAGGFWGHGGSYQTRPEIHIPLMIRTPGQERGSRVAVAADQTSVAPTVLELAGLPRPEWMRSPSLLPWLNSENQGEGRGLAFTQYLETNSIFKPLHHGTVGVIDGRNQYILNLSSRKGILRPLAEAQSMNLDCSAANPALAQSLRDAIYARFPDLPRETS